jgi:hypothetical protein
MPRKVEEIVLDGNSLASLSTSETPQIAYDRRPDSALIAEFRTRRIRISASRRGRTRRCVVNPATASLANGGRESSWSGILQIQLQCGFRFSDRVAIANPDLGPALAGIRRRIAMRLLFSVSQNH